MNANTMIIAEAGVNHNGSLLLAKRLINEAASAGADAVKFQTFRSEKVVTKIGKKANYQIDGTSGSDSQLEMIRQLELSDKSFHKLADHANHVGIEFLSTPFDKESAYFLNNEIGVRLNKIPSGEITNVPLLRSIGKLKKKVIMSTGMSSMKEITTGVQILIKSGLRKKNISVLHCSTEYPANNRS